MCCKQPRIRTGLCCGLLMAMAGALQAVPASAAEPPSHRWAVLVGVNDYANLQDLRYCSHDVAALEAQLIAAGFDAERVVAIHSEASDAQLFPSKANIERQLELILGFAEPGDVLLVAFSGHGMQLDGRTYLCPADADPDRPDTMVPLADIYTRLDACRASLKLLVADACRNDPRPAGRRSATAEQDLQQLAESLQKPPEGIVVLSSCTAGEVSMESEDFGQGVFMHFLLEGLGGAADVDGQPGVSLYEAARYTAEHTKLYVYRTYNGSQRPELNKATVEALAFPLAIPIGQQRIVNSIGMELALIPAGSFDMGSTPAQIEHASRMAGGSEPDALNDEKPRHRVQITRSFFMGVHEVTRGQFAQFVADAGYQTEAETNGEGGWGHNSESNKFEQGPQYTWRDTGHECGDSHPAMNVSWNDAMAFCRWLSVKEGRAYRLPTEAQWEYACRAGGRDAFAFGDDPEQLAEYANVSDAAAHEQFDHWNAITARDGYVFTTPVGSFQPNRWGLYDLHGNVWEWCRDWYAEDYYGRSPRSDPQGASTGKFRVYRGGSSYDPPGLNRSAYRSNEYPAHADCDLGFRVVLVPPSQMIVNSLGMELALVRAGGFDMGSTPEQIANIKRIDSSFQTEWANPEMPQHRVQITRPFYMGVHEVTRGQFAQFVAATEYKTDAESDPQGGQGVDSATNEFEQNPRYSWRETGADYSDLHPVVNVSWNDAQAFCRWLSAKEGQDYRLPTEAQWEYACRAGTRTRYSFGDEVQELVRYANIIDDTARARFGNLSTTVDGDDGYAFSAPVGSFQPNPWGLHDMYGNVHEWCADWFGEAYYRESPADDPEGPPSGAQRVCRGGWWLFPTGFARSAQRTRTEPATWDDFIGFRVVLISTSP